MEQINHLVQIANQFLDKEISADEFCTSFDNYFFDHEDEIYENQSAYDSLDNIRDAISVYEPNEAIRNAEEGLIDESELRSRVREFIKRIQ
jgi:hypothetical protein